MQLGDVTIFEDQAWQITEVHADDTITIRLLAGPVDVRSPQTIPSFLLRGRSIYRMLSVLNDKDIDRAVSEIASSVDTEALGHDPRKYAEAYYRRHGSRSTPDVTVVFSWFASLSGAVRDNERARASRKTIAPQPTKKPAKSSRSKK